MWPAPGDTEVLPASSLPECSERTRALGEAGTAGSRAEGWREDPPTCTLKCAGGGLLAMTAARGSQRSGRKGGAPEAGAAGPAAGGQL